MTNDKGVFPLQNPLQAGRVFIFIVQLLFSSAVGLILPATRTYALYPPCCTPYGFCFYILLELNTSFFY